VLPNGPSHRALSRLYRGLSHSTSERRWGLWRDGRAHAGEYHCPTAAGQVGLGLIMGSAGLRGLKAWSGCWAESGPGSTEDIDIWKCLSHREFDPAHADLNPCPDLEQCQPNGAASVKWYAARRAACPRQHRFETRHGAGNRIAIRRIYQSRRSYIDLVQGFHERPDHLLQGCSMAHCSLLYFKVGRPGHYLEMFDPRLINRNNRSARCRSAMCVLVPRPGSATWRYLHAKLCNVVPH